MDRQHNNEANGTRRSASAIHGIIAAGCVAGALLLGTTAEARTTATRQSNSDAVHSTVLRGQLTGNLYPSSRPIQVLAGTPTGNHWDVTTHTDTPHTDNGFWLWHTDNAHSDAYSHGDESSTPTTPPSP